MIAGILLLIILLALMAGLQEWQLWLQNKRVEALEAAASVPQGCQHTNVENEGTFGLPELICRDCGQRINDDA